MSSDDGFTGLGEALRGVCKRLEAALLWGRNAVRRSRARRRPRLVLRVHRRRLEASPRRAAARAGFLEQLTGPTWRRTLSVGMVMFLVWLGEWAIFDKFDPFGLVHASHEYSAKIIERLTAPFYRSQAQDQIVVLLIDESSLSARDMAWPPAYSFYGDLLRRVLAHRPKAVFLDILLERRRDYDGSFEEANLDFSNAASFWVAAEACDGRF